jgi:hypothetical protein
VTAPLLERNITILDASRTSDSYTFAFLGRSAIPAEIIQSTEAQIFGEIFTKKSGTRRCKAHRQRGVIIDLMMSLADFVESFSQPSYTKD